MDRMEPASSWWARAARLARNARWWITATPAERRHSRVGPAYMWKMKRAFQIDFLKRMGLEPHHRVLDVGCGTLRGGLPVVEYLEAGHYAGFDIRKASIAEAHKELAEAGLEAKQPSLHVVPDISALDLGQTFDYIWAFSVLVHMSDEILDDCFASAARHLASGGRFFGNVRTGEWPDEDRTGYVVVTRDLDFYRDIAGRYGLTVAEHGTLESLGHVSGDPKHDLHIMLEMRHAD